MAQRNGVISLQSFIKKYFFKRGMDEGLLHRYRVIAADGLRELHINHLPITQTAVLTIDTTNYTADYPDDYVNYVLIGVEDNGKWWTFTREDDMVDKTIVGIDGSDLGDRRSLVGYGNVGGKNDFYFKLDNNNRRFLFDESYSSNVVVLKYKSTGVESVDYSSISDIEFPVYAENAMECYLDFRIAEIDRGAMNDRQWKKKLYDDAVLMMRDISHNITMSEIRDLWAGSSNQTIIR